MYRTVAAFALPFVMATSSHAQSVELIGGHTGVKYSSFLNSVGGRALSQTQIDLGFEVALHQKASIQLEYGQHFLNASGETTSSYGAHANFHFNDSGSIGAFVAADATRFGTDYYYGGEFGYGLSRASSELYVGAFNSAGLHGTIYGLEGEFGFSDRQAAFVGFDAVTAAGVTGNVLRLGAKSQLADNFELSAELGTATLSAFGGSGSEEFVGIGAKFSFGGDRGTTFSRRNPISRLPGL